MGLDFGTGMNLARMQEFGAALGNNSDCSKAEAMEGFASSVLEKVPNKDNFPQLKKLAKEEGEGSFENTKENQRALLLEIKDIIKSHPTAITEKKF